MSEEDKIYAFVAFGVESYKQANGLSGAEAAQKFARYGVDEYLRDEYDVLHTLGQRELLDDINRFIEVRK